MKKVLCNPVLFRDRSNVASFENAWILGMIAG